MATAALNPIIQSISGRFGNAVFYRRGNTQCVRTYVVPRNPDTALQREIRKSFASAVKSWQAMTQEEKYAYTRKARNLGMTGYNLFISVYITGNCVRYKKYKTGHDIVSSSQYPLYLNRIHSVSEPFLLKDSKRTRPEYG
ncbi:MAG: hypothetical protein JW864_16050 [Spirochaetes bacterium]|nr:hypothetical protein [Spirochaetota bacterium]